MDVVKNGLFVLIVVIAALYLAPYLIALMASGLLQLVLAIVFMGLIIKMVKSARRHDVDRD